jgi:hypothetical protein
MAQVVEHMSNKCKSLSSNLSTAKKSNNCKSEHSKICVERDKTIRKEDDSTATIMTEQKEKKVWTRKKK